MGIRLILATIQASLSVQPSKNYSRNFPSGIFVILVGRPTFCFFSPLSYRTRTFYLFPELWDIDAMENQMNHLNPQSATDSKMWVTVAIAVVVTALLVGAGVFAWQRAMATKQQAELQELVQQLQLQITQQATSYTANSPLPTSLQATATPVPASDNRPLLNANDIGGSVAVYAPYIEAATVGTPNNAPANTTVPYSNSTKGLSMQLPFNTQWGTDKYRIPGYDENNIIIAFGPLTYCSPDGLCRAQIMKHIPVKSADQLINELQQDQITANQKTINGLTVVEFVSPGQCTSAMAVVFGKKYNYEFQTCTALSNYGPDYIEDFQYLENIIKTVKLS